MQFSKTLAIFATFATMAFALPGAQSQDAWVDSATDNSGSGNFCNGDRVAACCNTQSISTSQSNQLGNLLGLSGLGLAGFANGLFSCGTLNVPVNVPVIGGAGSLTPTKNSQCSQPNKCCPSKKNHQGVVVVDATLIGDCTDIL